MVHSVSQILWMCLVLWYFDLWSKNMDVLSPAFQLLWHFSSSNIDNFLFEKESSASLVTGSPRTRCSFSPWINKEVECKQQVTYRNLLCSIFNWAVVGQTSISCTLQEISGRRRCFSYSGQLPQGILIYFTLLIMKWNLNLYEQTGILYQSYLLLS